MLAIERRGFAIAGSGLFSSAMQALGMATAASSQFGSAFRNPEHSELLKRTSPFVGNSTSAWANEYRSAAGHSWLRGQPVVPAQFLT